MRTQPTRPDGRLLLKETRVLADSVRMLGRLARPVRATIQCEPIIVLPGFGAGERSMRPLRNYLRRHGLTVEDWGLGINRAGLDIPHTIGDLGPTWEVEPKAAYRREGGVPVLCDRMVERVRERAQFHASKMVLVGWSLGGTIAREVARDAPDAISQVITLLPDTHQGEQTDDDDKEDRRRFRPRHPGEVHNPYTLPRAKPLAI